jgi:hypothetical protein
MATKIDRLRKAYEFKLGKDLAAKLTDAQIKILSSYYNSLSESEQSDIDNKISMGKSNDLLDIARSMVEENESGEPPDSGPPEDEREPDGPSALTLYEGVRETDLVDEEIDERILRLIGEENTFDIDYGTYISLLKEKMVEGRMNDSKLSSDETELLTEEWKRVKGKVGRFRIKKKPYDSPFSAGSAITISKDKFFAVEKVNPVESQQQNDFSRDNFADNISAIRKSVENIVSLLTQQNKLFLDQIRKGRLLKEKQNRKKKESLLEKAGKGTFKMVKGVLAPVQNLLDRIIKFLSAVFLGRLVLKLFRWMSDPKNKGKVDAILRFLKDWGPALIAGYLLFGTAIGRLVRTVIGTLVKLTFAILRKGIPAAMNLIRKNPKAAAAIALFTAGATIPMLFPDTVDAEEKKTKSAPGTKEEKIEALKKQKENLNPMQKMQGVGSEIDEQIYKLETGETKSYSGGGIVKMAGGGAFRNLNELDTFKKETLPKFEGGKVTPKTGKKIVGAGKDTQLTALEPGEIVISKPAVEKYGSNLFLTYNKMGGGTNKPKIAKGVQLASGGGLIGPINNNIKLNNGFESILNERSYSNEKVNFVSNSGGLNNFITENSFVNNMDSSEVSKFESSSFMNLDSSKVIPSKNTIKYPINQSNFINNFDKSDNKLIDPPDKVFSSDKYPTPFTGEPKEGKSNFMKLDSGMPQKKSVGKTSATILSSNKTETLNIPTPPESKINIIQLSSQELEKSNMQKRTGTRSVDTDFPTYYPNRTRSTLIMTYGIEGIE